MQNFSNKLLLALATLLAINLILSCEKECPPVVATEDSCSTDNECSRGFTCINGTCGCPEDGLIFNGHCISGTPEWPTWRGTTSSCYCYDTISFGIVGTGEARTLSMLFADGDNIGSASTGVDYFTKTDGDSLHVFQMPIKCARTEGNKLIPEAFGKIKPNGNMEIRLVFRDGVTLEYVDECITTLRRVE